METQSKKIIKILIVEDDLVVRKFVGQMLLSVQPNDKYGFEITPAGFLDQALNLLNEPKSKFDLILLDLNLPDSEGLNTLSEVTGGYPYLPVIVITGQADKELGLEAIKRGAQDYLEKSAFNLSRLQEAIGFALERKQKEKRVKKANKEAFYNLIEETPDGIVILDQDWQIAYMNIEAKSIFGFNNDEYQGELFGFPLVSGKSTELDIIDKKNGKNIIAELRAINILWDEKKATLITIHDITARKEVSRLEAEKEAAVIAGQAKEEFLATMSHEIRTPLNGIIMASEMLMDMEPTDKQHKFINIVKSSGDNLMSLISDILDFSKIEAKQLELAPIDFNLRMLVESTLIPFSVQAVDKQISLSWEVASDVPYNLIGDPTRVRQVIVNLIGNALKFTEKGKISMIVTRDLSFVDRDLSFVDLGVNNLEDREVITYNPRVTDYEARTPNPESQTTFPESISLHFYVNDTGIGIPKQKQKDIFDAFTQATQATSRKYGGTGLGLAICKKLVELMGGKLWVESPSLFTEADKEGDGSSFQFVLPFRMIQPTRVIERTELADYDIRNIKILVVNDPLIDNIKKIPNIVLTGQGMTAVETTKIQKALELLKEAIEKKYPYQAIILNYSTSEDCFKAAQQINSITSIPIIISTALGLRGDANRCYQLGICAYLVHPIKKNELRQVVKLALKQVVSEKPDKQLITRHTLQESGQGVRILLVEDNEVNQEVIGGILKMRGFVVEIADCGEQALEMLGVKREADFVSREAEESQTSCRDTIHEIRDTKYELRFTNYDLILMDVQMPGISGLEATKIIREQEKTKGTHTPIIGLTAHATQKIRDDCFQAGMDDYLSKPLRADQLYETVDRYSSFGLCDLSLVNRDSEDEEINNKSRTTNDERRTTDQESPINMEQALANVGGNLELLKNGVTRFIANYPEKIAKIKKAVEDADSKEVNKAAHSLKGAAGMIRANKVQALASEIEDLAEQNNLLKVKVIIPSMEEELEEVGRFTCMLEW
ncbi:MAG: response regulator [bacterium]